MKLIIVSGLSGSGKSIALDTLEDCGFYCIDNLPVSLLESFINDEMLADKVTYERTAIGIDARNQSENLANFSECLKMIKSKGIASEVIYMQAEQSTLLKRYSETRRRHPLTDLNLSLEEAINIEKGVLKSVAKYADLVIDTSRTSFHQLRELIKNHVGAHEQGHLSLLFQSFGFKHGVPLDADFVFDARSLPNPYWVPALRGLTGKDPAVIEFLSAESDFQEFFQDVRQFLSKWISHFEADNRSYLTIAIGCTGGQHRSVYLIDCLADHFKGGDTNVIRRHRELL